MFTLIITIVNHLLEFLSRSCCRCTRNAARQLTRSLNRKDNSLVLSETLDENALQTLLDLSIADRFPEQCDEWLTVKKSISDSTSRELAKRQGVLFEEPASKEYEMQRVLCNAVVGDVMELFPYVLFISPLVIECSGHRP